jgi:ets translocation variant 5
VFPTKKQFDNFTSSDKTLDEKCRDTLENRSANFQNSTGRRGSLQLWQFLVALLDAPDASAGCIAWTGRGMEFKLIEPEEVDVITPQ